MKSNAICIGCLSFFGAIGFTVWQLAETLGQAIATR